MTYQADWTQSDAQGELSPGADRIRAVDVTELAEAINRRRMLAYNLADDFSSQAAAGQYVRAPLVSTQLPPPFTSFRRTVEQILLNAPAGGMGGDPSSPASMYWLWPVDDGDEDKIIVTGFAGVGAGEVGLFSKLNGGDDWTGGALWAGQTPVRAIHVNELRRAIQWLRRGRWTLPIYGAAGVYSALPDTPWLTDAVYAYAGQELRCVGFAVVRTDEQPARGIAGVTVRDTSGIRIIADAACTMEVYRCKRAIDFVDDPPTWNEYRPATSDAWQTAGGLGGDDAEYVGSVSCPADQPADLTGSTVAGAMQEMVDGEPANLLLRRSDTGTRTIGFTAEMIVEFDLNCPPN